MRLLHCSDLHLGKRVHECSMTEEQRHILKQIASIAVAQQVDGIIIAGDLYDKLVPSIEAVGLLDEFLTSLWEQHLPVYLISGNHDSPERLSFGTQLLEQNDVYLAGVFTGKAQHLSLQDAYGALELYLLPFIKPAVVRSFYPEESIETYEDAVRVALSHSHIDPQKRNVLVAHQFVTNNGREPERSDSETLSVGALDQVDVSLFDGFDYVALGHIHGPQKIGRETVRYCGSPLKYSFSEWRHKKSVTIVELKEKGIVLLEQVPLQPIHDLREIRGTLSSLLQPEVVAQGDPQDYLRVILTDEIPPYDPLGQLRQVYPNLLRLDFERNEAAAMESITAAQDVEEKTIMELFSDFYEMANDRSMNEAERAVMEQIWKEQGGVAL